MVLVQDHPITVNAARPGPKLHKSTQRLLVAVLGCGATMTVAFAAAGDRLTAATSLDDVQAIELSNVRACLEFIRDGGDAHSKKWARVALDRLDRAAEADRTRDEHVDWICKLVTVARSAARRVASAIERALLGQGAPGTGGMP